VLQLQAIGSLVESNSRMTNQSVAEHARAWGFNLVSRELLIGPDIGPRHGLGRLSPKLKLLTCDKHRTPVEIQFSGY
jgi:hypothetical protein